MKPHWIYLQYVLRHKWYVFQECLKYGLIWEGIVHDLSKFRPSEWFPYVEFLYGMQVGKRVFGTADNAPFDGVIVEIRDLEGYRYKVRHDSNGKAFWMGDWEISRVAEKQAFIKACQLHYDRNPHHWNHWVKGGKPSEMPLKLALEMVCDWKAVSRDKGTDPVEWYLEQSNKLILHWRTRLIIEHELGVN